jgi:glyoxylase-like metal-dependent hydrolase (beta-lactamase superfamily II)
MLKAKSAIKSFSPIETKEITSNIFAIQDSFSNLFLIKDGESFIAIDAGNDLDAVSKELKKLKINSDLVTAVLLTHTDGDHVAAISLFKNATIYLSDQEEQLLNGKKSRFLFFGNKIDTEEYSLIQDQQTFNIGNIKIKGILTPGHTPGSMCYLVNDKFLFAGDALSLKEGKIDLMNTFFNMDTETATKSMSLITKLPDASYIFTAHYGFTDDYRKAVESWNQR